MGGVLNKDGFMTGRKGSKRIKKNPKIMFEFGLEVWIGTFMQAE